MSDFFDYIGGTSTGAIIAAGLSRGMSVGELLQFYEQMLGADSAWVGTSLNNLARLYWAMGRYEQALPLYQQCRVTRTARIVLSGREMGRLYHAAGVERLVRNSLWKGRSQERFYDAIEWLYGWNVKNCLST